MQSARINTLVDFSFELDDVRSATFIFALLLLQSRRVQASQMAVAFVLEASVVCIRRGGVIEDGAFVIRYRGKVHSSAIVFS